MSAFPGEQPILDVPLPDGVGCEDETAVENPGCVRQVVRLSGTHTLIQGLTFQNGLAHDFKVNGGENHTLKCNTFRYTVDFGMRSDQLKIDGDATNVLVAHNDFSGWSSQAIDMTAVFDVVIEHNVFHDPVDPAGGATGTKYGSRGVIIRDNVIHDLGTDPQAHAFALGGTGSPHDADFTAYDVQVVGNQIWNMAGFMAQITSCKDCRVEDNVAYDVGAGVLLDFVDDRIIVGECTTAPAQTCLDSEGTRIAGNRLTVTSDAFVAVEANQGEGLIAEDNRYCESSAGAARFGWQVSETAPLDLVDFESWKGLSGTDGSSVVLAAGDPECGPP